MIKDIMDLDKKLRTKLNVIQRLITYFKIKSLSSNIKKNIMKDNVISEKDLILFIQILNYASSYLKNFDLKTFSQWFILLDSTLGIKIFINYDPVYITLYCGNEISYRYEILLKKPNSNNEINNVRYIEDAGLNEESSYMYDSYVYKFMKTYISATIDIIEQIWIDMLKSQVIQ